MNSNRKVPSERFGDGVTPGDWAQWHWTIACKKRDELLDTLARAEKALPRGTDEHSRLLRAHTTLLDLLDHVFFLKALVRDSERKR